MLFTLPLYAQRSNWDCSSFTTYKNQVMLRVNLNAGITSYFGDLSIYDVNPAGKIIKESLPGFGGIAILQLNKTFSIAGQILQANLQSSMDSISFRTEIFEYNFHGRVDFLKLLKIPHYPGLCFEGYAGLGQFYYSVEKQIETGPNIIETSYKVDVPEFVYFFGGSITYRITKYISLSLDLAIRQCQTDRLDDYVAHRDFDYYSYFSLGTTIEIGRIINPYLKSRYSLTKRKYTHSWQICDCKV